MLHIEGLSHAYKSSTDVYTQLVCETQHPQKLSTHLYNYAALQNSSVELVKRVT